MYRHKVFIVLIIIIISSSNLGLYNNIKSHNQDYNEVKTNRKIQSFSLEPIFISGNVNYTNQNLILNRTWYLMPGSCVTFNNVNITSNGYTINVLSLSQLIINKSNINCNIERTLIKSETNSNITIINSKIYSNGKKEFYLMDSRSCNHIENNELSNVSLSISMNNNSVISFNVFHYYSKINIYYYNFVLIKNNTFYSDVIITYSNNITLRNNIFINSSYIMYGEDKNFFTLINDNNLVNGKILQLYNSLGSINLIGQSFGEIILFNITEINLRDLLLFNLIILNCSNVLLINVTSNYGKSNIVFENIENLFVSNSRLNITFIYNIDYFEITFSNINLYIQNSKINRLNITSTYMSGVYFPWRKINAQNISIINSEISFIIFKGNKIYVSNSIISNSAFEQFDNLTFISNKILFASIDYCSNLLLLSNKIFNDDIHFGLRVDYSVNILMIENNITYLFVLNSINLKMYLNNLYYIADFGNVSNIDLYLNNIFANIYIDNSKNVSLSKDGLGNYWKYRLNHELINETLVSNVPIYISDYIDNYPLLGQIQAYNSSFFASILFKGISYNETRSMILLPYFESYNESEVSILIDYGTHTQKFKLNFSKHYRNYIIYSVVFPYRLENYVDFQIIIQNDKENIIFDKTKYYFEDQSGPLLVYYSYNPMILKSGESFNITFTVLLEDFSGVKNVTLCYNTNGIYQNISMKYDPTQNVWYVNIQVIVGETFSFYIISYDYRNNMMISETFYISTSINKDISLCYIFSAIILLCVGVFILFHKELSSKID